MDKFQYDMLLKRTQNNRSHWVLASAPNRRISNFMGKLNQLGRQGWEVAVAGDFGNDSRAEIILKRRVD